MAKETGPFAFFKQVPLDDLRWDQRTRRNVQKLCEERSKKTHVDLAYCVNSRLHVASNIGKSEACSGNSSGTTMRIVEARVDRNTPVK